MNEWEKARDAYRHALEANPANGWVRSTLLPEAEKKLAAVQTGSGARPAAEAKPAADAKSSKDRQ